MIIIDGMTRDVGDFFRLGHTAGSDTTGSLTVWGRGASDGLVPSGGPSLYVAVIAVGDACITP